MKKIVSLILVLSMIVGIFSANASAETNTTDTQTTQLYSLDILSQANKIMLDKNFDKYMRSDNYVYWNFFVKTNTNAGTFFQHTIRDDLYNDGLFNTFKLSFLSQDAVDEVLSEFIQTYMQQNTEKYERLMTLENIVTLCDHLSEYTQNLRSCYSSNEIKNMQNFVSQANKYKAQLSECVEKGTLDPTTLQWAKSQLDNFHITENQINKTSSTLSMIDSLDKIGTASDTAKIIEDMFRWKQNTIDKLNEIQMLKYASTDVTDFLESIVSTCPDKMIKKKSCKLDY